MNPPFPTYSGSSCSTFCYINDRIDGSSFLWLGLDTLVVIVIASVFCLLLLYIIGRINHPVKFFLILATSIIMSLGIIFSGKKPGGTIRSEMDF
jgi:hypothetical protein